MSVSKIQPPYYEVTVRLPLDLYEEQWFDKVADAAGENAAVSGAVIPYGRDAGGTSMKEIQMDDQKVEVTLEDGRTGELNPSWLAEAADTVEWRWEQYLAASRYDPVTSAGYLIELSNAISDLASFIPGYNMETGDVERPGDEE